MASNLMKNLGNHVGLTAQWLRDIACKLPEFNASPAVFLLAGIYLKLTEIAELLGPGENFYRIDHFDIEADAKAKRVLDKDTVNGRVRRVVIWIDSGLGGPVPTIRLSTQASAANSIGLQLVPSTWNEIGRIPANTELYLSSNADIGLNIAIEG